MSGATGRVACVVLCGLSLAVLGCGPNLGKPTSVSGKVTVDDQPLANAPLAFHAIGEVAAEFRTFTAMTDAGGQYKIDPIYPGKYEVMIVEASGAGASQGQETEATNPLQPADGKELQVTIGAEPAVYDMKLKRR